MDTDKVFESLSLYVSLYGELVKMLITLEQHGIFGSKAYLS